MKKSLLCFLVWFSMFSVFSFSNFYFESVYARIISLAIFLISWGLSLQLIYRDKQYYWFASYITGERICGNIFFNTETKDLSVKELQEYIKSINNLDCTPIVMSYKRVSKKQAQRG